MNYTHHILIPFRQGSEGLPDKAFRKLPQARQDHHTMVWMAARVAREVADRLPQKTNIVLCSPEGLNYVATDQVLEIAAEVRGWLWERPDYLCTPNANLANTIYEFMGHPSYRRGDYIWVMQPTVYRDPDGSAELGLIRSAQTYGDPGYTMLWVSAYKAPGYVEKYLPYGQMHYGPPPTPWYMGPRQLCSPAFYPNGRLFGFRESVRPDGKRCAIQVLEDIPVLDIDSYADWRRMTQSKAWWADPCYDVSAGTNPQQGEPT